MKHVGASIRHERNGTSHWLLYDISTEGGLVSQDLLDNIDVGELCLTTLNMYISVGNTNSRRNAKCGQLSS